MKKTPTLILLLLILIPTFAFSQKKRKARKPVIVTDTIVAPVDIQPIKPLDPFEVDGGPVIEPVPEIQVYFRVTNTERIDRVYAYFYCPQMEDSTFAYAEELGSDNNLTGGKYGRHDEWGYFNVPKKYYAGREILFKADGYKTTRVNIDNITARDTITATLEPDTYEYVIFYLSKLKEWDGKLLDSPNDKFFYGRCRPIMYKNGNHADPACAFGGTGANRYINEKVLINTILSIEGIEKRLQKKAKKGQFILYLYSPADNDKNPKEFAADIPVLEESVRKLFPLGAKVKLTFRIWKGK